MQDVDALVEKGNIVAAIELLNSRIAIVPDADILYMRGRLHWRMGNKGEAMSDYAAAVELDPKSPAAQALELAREVMAFYNKDMYNP